MSAFCIASRFAIFASPRERRRKSSGKKGKGRTRAEEEGLGGRMEVEGRRRGKESTLLNELEESVAISEGIDAFPEDLRIALHFLQGLSLHLGTDILQLMETRRRSRTRRRRRRRAREKVRKRTAVLPNSAEALTN